MKYLEVDFYDNDFGYPIRDAVKKIWDWIFESNEHMLMGGEDWSDKTLSQVFQALHEAGALQPMIQRTYQIECLHSAVEFATRGLYWKEVKWEKKKIGLLSAKELGNCDSIDIKFRPDDSFMRKTECTNNGESLVLNLETGEIITSYYVACEDDDG